LFLIPPPDFAADILLACGPARFGPWAFHLSAELAAGASYHPLLSGYYR
jgi:hypothetical protein